MVNKATGWTVTVQVGPDLRAGRMGARTLAARPEVEPHRRSTGGGREGRPPTRSKSVRLAQQSSSGSVLLGSYLTAWRKVVRGLDAFATVRALCGIPLRALAVLLLAGGVLPLRAVDLEAVFRDPPAAARPWVFWYWMQAAASREGITADLEAMRDAGIGGAYLMSIKGPATPPHVEPPVEQLTPEWWALVRHAMVEADRLGLELAMHACDGFATAGGPWITPELSMQRVVWSETILEGGRAVDLPLPEPPQQEDYYRDIAVFAYPAVPDAESSSSTTRPVVTSNLPQVNAQVLADPTNEATIRSEQACWFEYRFEHPFTARSLSIRRGGSNYQAHRLRVEASDDGRDYRFVAQLDAPRHGWQDRHAGVTHALPPTTARFFRFSWDPAGSEPGGEDLDSAKWRAVLRLQSLELSGAPRLHQFEGKTGAVWRISPSTQTHQLPDDLAVRRESLVDLTKALTPDGRLRWEAPAGRWTILRLGHTSTGQVNETGGAGQGLEADKFNPAAARLQYDRWFGEARRVAGSELAGRVLKGFHVDSWEAGSQNWSTGFPEEFRRRRGYDLHPWMPLFAGVPVESVAASERVLRDVRRTIAELVVDNFFRPLAERARADGCWFSAENVAPTMMSDGLAHFAAVDVPMGEFWLRSPTHDKPNDMLDAISGARVYGKPLVQAEAFTQLRMSWDEHPGMLKTLGDRNYALGINRFVYHVFAHNPWLDRAPGMTLDGVGLYFQRDQTWWQPGRAWVEYAQRVQALLQQGRPVVDLAVFTGEEVPARAVRPERLVDTLPGLVGEARVEQELARRRNDGQPLRELPAGVRASANLADPRTWVDPLGGYAYDSINRDALLRLAVPHERDLHLPGASYRVLVLPEQATPGIPPPPRSAELEMLVATVQRAGIPVIEGRFDGSSLAPFGLAPDLLATRADGTRATDIAWTHRRGDDFDLYFVSNQLEQPNEVELSLRVAGRHPEVWDPVTGETRPATRWRRENDRTALPLRFEAAQSVFVVFRGPTDLAGEWGRPNQPAPEPVADVAGEWTVTFDSARGGPAEPRRIGQLFDWSEDAALRAYSGTGEYRTHFVWKGGHGRVWLDLGRVENLAEVSVNGEPCGVAWTAPYRVEITGALRPGRNELRIAVTNTWRNRLIADSTLDPAKRVTATTAPDRWSKEPVLPAGLLGPVRLLAE